MPLVSLLCAFENGVSGGSTIEISNPPKPDELVEQRSFQFIKPNPRIIFISATGKPVEKYKDLAQLPLSTEEQAIVKARKEELEQAAQKSDKVFYDGKHMLLIKALYDTSYNILILEAARCSYTAMNCLQQKKFPRSSSLYKRTWYNIGCLAPFITKDNYTSFMERNDPFKLWSAASGFLESKGGHSQQNLSILPYKTAIEESCEEVLFDRALHPRINHGDPYLAGVSIRKVGPGKGDRSAFEFVCALPLNCDRDFLTSVLQTNEAPDRKEHTDQFSLVPLDPADRSQAVTFLARKNPGVFLYHPMLILSSQHHNGYFVPQCLPDSRTRNYYLLPPSPTSMPKANNTLPEETRCTHQTPEPPVI